MALDSVLCSSLDARGLWGRMDMNPFTIHLNYHNVNQLCGDGGLVAKSCLTLATPWTVVHKAPLSMGFSRQEYWIGLPFPSPRDLPNPGIKPPSLLRLLHCRWILYC